MIGTDLNRAAASQLDERINMRFKRIGAAMATSLVLLLVLAGSAQAEVWTAGGSKFEAGQTETFTSKLKSATLALEGTISEVAIKATATGVECVECKIEQIGSGETGVTRTKGRLKLTGVSISKPSGCKTSATLESVPITTTHRKRVLWGLWESHTVETLGEEEDEELLSVKVEGCTLSGTYKLTGAMAGRSSADGVFSVAQPVTYSAAIQKEEEVKLKLDGSAASLTGEIVNELSGTKKGKEWGITES